MLHHQGSHLNQMITLVEQNGREEHPVHKQQWQNKNEQQQKQHEQNEQEQKKLKLIVALKGTAEKVSDKQLEKREKDFLEKRSRR